MTETSVEHAIMTDAQLHVPGYVQAGDPGAVGAGKVWIDTTGGVNAWIIKIRNAANDGWEIVGFSNISEYILPENLLSTQRTLLEDFEAGWERNSGCTIADDTIHFKTGTKALEITLTTPGTGGYVDNPTVSLDLSSYDSFRVVVWNANKGATFASLRLYLFSESSKYFQQVAGNYIQRMWTVFEFPKVLFTDTGGADWSSINKMRLYLVAQVGETTIISIDSFTGGPQHIQPTIRFEFDDGWESVYTEAYPYMKARNMVGTCYIITDRIGTAGYMTAAQLLEMYANGWAIANHTDDHTNLTTLDQATQQTRLVAGKTALDALGMTKYSDMVAYPYNEYNEDTLAAMAAINFKTGRGYDANYPDYLPPADDYVLGTFTVSNTISLATAKSQLDTKINQIGNQSFLFHKLVATPGATIEWSIADFQAFVDYVFAQKVQTLNVGEFYNLQSGLVVMKHR